MIVLSCFEFVDIKLDFTANYFINPIIRALYIEFMSVLVKLKEVINLDQLSPHFRHCATKHHARFLITKDRKGLITEDFLQGPFTKIETSEIMFV